MDEFIEILEQRRAGRSDADCAAEMTAFGLGKVTQTTVNRWRRSKNFPEPDKHAPLAAWLGISVGELLQVIYRARAARGMSGGDSLAIVQGLIERVTRLEAELAALRASPQPEAPAERPSRSAPSAPRTTRRAHKA